MNEDMRAEVLEMCVNACEKHTSNNENAAKMVKEQLDKRFGKMTKMPEASIAGEVQVICEIIVLHF